MNQREKFLSLESTILNLGINKYTQDYDNSQVPSSLDLEVVKNDEASKSTDKG